MIDPESINNEEMNVISLKVPRGTEVFNVGLSNMLGCGSLVPCPIEDTLFCLRLVEVAAKQTRPCCLIRRLSQIVTSKGLIRVVMRCVIYFVFVQISMCTWCCPNNLTSWTNS
jgi:hypothetical protein